MSDCQKVNASLSYAFVTSCKQESPSAYNLGTSNDDDDDDDDDDHDHDHDHDSHSDDCDCCDISHD